MPVPQKDNFTAGLGRMNLVLHNKGAGVVVGNKSTFSAPQYKEEDNPELLKTFNYIMVNPPFLDKSWMDGITFLMCTADTAKRCWACRRRKTVAMPGCYTF